MVSGIQIGAEFSVWMRPFVKYNALFKKEFNFIVTITKTKGFYNDENITYFIHIMYHLQNSLQY